MVTRMQASSWLASINVKAFFRVIRAGESWNDRDDNERDELAFRVRYGGWDAQTRKHRPPRYFDGFEDHPRVYEPTPTGDVSSAAGAFQITATTWDDLRRQFPWLGPNFGPFEQQLAAALLIYRRGALDDVIDGRLEEAVAKCGREWASLPGSPLEDGGSKVAWERVRAVWREWGGGVPHIAEISPTDAPVSAPIEQATDPDGDSLPGLPGFNPPKEAAVAAPLMFILPLLQGLFQVFSPLLQSKLSTALNKETQDKPMADTMAQQILAIVQQVAAQAGVPLATDAAAGTATAPKPAAPPANDLVAAADAIAKVKASPALVAKAEAEIEDWLAKVSPLVDKVAEFERAAWQASEESMDRAAARGASGSNDDWMALALIGGMLAMAGTLILFILGIAVAQVWQSGTPSTEVWAAVTGLIGSVFGIAGGVFAYRFGTTRQSTAKDITSAALAGELSRRTTR